MRRLLIGAWLALLPASAGAADLTSLKQSVVAGYASLVRAVYEDALAGARALAGRIDAFVDDPGADALARARQAWIDSRVAYAQSEAFRFSDGPIDAVEGLINSWPIDESLIDYVEGEPGAGFINHPERYPAVTAEAIAALNEKGGEKNITAGFHAIEFLLWGQDLDDDGPGHRSYLDYTEGHAPNAGRRRDYLRVTAHLLVRNLETVTEAWAPDSPSNYRAAFVTRQPDESLAAIVKGIGVLTGSELAGERLTVPYETKDQEDEHSCFSDNTHRDLLFNVTGIRNVYLGRYVRASGETVAGRSLADLVERVNPALAAKLARQMDASLAAARALPPPFDRAIRGNDSAPGRIAVKALITALRAQANAIADAGAALGLKLNF